MEVSDTPDFVFLCAELGIAPGTAQEQRLSIRPGMRALYFRFRGEGVVNFHAFTLSPSAGRLKISNVPSGEELFRFPK